MFSKACEYGIRAMIFIAHQSGQGNRVSLKQVAQAIDSPVAFTAKILQSLTKSNLINSVKGAGGGYELLDERMSEVTLCKIVTAIDGDEILTKCGLGLKRCTPEKPCPIHPQFRVIRERLKAVLERTSVQDLADEVEFGTAFLKV